MNTQTKLLILLAKKFLEFALLLIVRELRQREMYEQKWTNVLKIYKPCLNYRRQKG